MLVSQDRFAEKTLQCLSVNFLFSPVLTFVQSYVADSSLFTKIARKYGVFIGANNDLKSSETFKFLRPAQHSTAQHSTAQHSNAPQCLKEIFL